MIRILSALLLIIFLSTGIQSRHLIGGHFEYVCVNSSGTNNLLSIKLVLIRDAASGGAEFDLDAAIGVFEDLGNGDYSHVTTFGNLGPSFIEPLDLSGYLPFSHFTTQIFEKGVYEIDVLLEKGKNYVISYQRCCFTDDVTNILDSGETGLGLTLEISSLALDQCDNSPVVPGLPFIIAPIGVEINHPIAAADPEGNDMDINYGRFGTGGGTNGVTSGSPRDCNGILPDPGQCPPPYAEPVYQLQLYSKDDPFGDNEIVLDTENFTFRGMASFTGKYAYSIELTQSSEGQFLSKQYIQYTPTFVPDIGVGRMVVSPYFDINNNGLKESGEETFKDITLQNVQVINNRVGSDGVIYLKTPPGQYDVEAHLPEGWQLPHPGRLSLNISDERIDYEIDLPVTQIDNIKNITAQAHFSTSDCNDSGLLNVNIKNEGTDVETGKIIISNDGKYQWQESQDGTYEIKDNNAILNVNSLAPTDHKNYSIRIVLPDASSTGEKSTTEIEIEDENKVLEIIEDIKCSETPADILSQKEINSPEERLLFTIRFRNDHPATVFQTRIKQNLNTYLDLTSIRIEGASHSFSYDLNMNNGELLVDMENISLTSYDDDQIQSTGYITYSIAVQEDTPQGEALSHQATIFMDNNKPFITDVVSTIYNGQTSSTINPIVNSLLFSPNPFSESIILMDEKLSGQLMIRDIQGRKHWEGVVSPGDKISTQALNRGIYFFSLTTEKGELFVGKYIKI